MPIYDLIRIADEKRTDSMTFIRWVSVFAGFTLGVAAFCPAFALRGDGVTVEKAWSRPTPGGATVGAVYLEIFGDEKNADRLIGVSSPVAGRAEFHTHKEIDGVMKMRKLDSIEIAPGTSHLFQPGGDHIMLFDLKEPLKQGTAVELTLTFEKAGEVKVTAKVLWKDAKGPDAAPHNAGSDDGSGSGSGSGSDSGSGSGSGSHQ
jgi:hypothetical protein